MKYKKVF